MRERFFGIALLSVCSVFAGPITRKGGHVVQLSSGETVKVGYYEEIAVDNGTRQPTGGHMVTIMQSSSGEIIGMHSTTTRPGKSETTIWSAHSKDKVVLEMDSEFTRAGLPAPTTVEINGERVKLMLERDTSGEHDKHVRAQLAPKVARLSPGFRDALRELARLGFAGYEGVGIGHGALLLLFDPNEIANGMSIVKQAPLSEKDQKAIGDALNH